MKYTYSYRIGDFYHSKHSKKVVYDLPIKLDTIVVIDSQVKKKKKRRKKSTKIDFSLPIGTEVYAARAGTVVEIVMENSKACPERNCDNFDNYILVMHDDGTIAKYGHLSPGSSIVEFGKKIKKGKLLAVSGMTGRTTIPSLHFEVYEVKRYKNKPVPTKFMHQGEAKLLLPGKYF